MRVSLYKSFAVCLLLGCAASVVAQSTSGGSFVNGNFETGDLTGWIQGAGAWSTPSQWPQGLLDASTYVPGGNNYNISYNRTRVLTAPQAPDPRTDGNLQPIYNGSNTAKVNDEGQDYSVSVISQTVANYTGGHIFFAWAAVLEGSHGVTDSDNFTLKLTDDTTHETLYNVAYNSADAASASLFHRSRNGGWFYTDWQVQDLDVTARTGHTFTLLLLASDCPYGGHAGYVYLDGFGAANPPSGEIPEEQVSPLTITSQSLGTFNQGATISATVTATGGVPPYTFSAANLPDGASFSGNVFSARAGAPGNYSPTVIVTDSRNNSAAASLNYAVFGLTSTTLPDVVQFSPYVATIGIAGGTLPYRFTATGLPEGLSINSSGVIQGIARSPGSSNIRFTVTDGEGHTFTGSIPLAVIAPLPLRITSNTLPSGTVGAVYSNNLTASGGAPPYSWSIVSGAVPTGLVFHSGGSITGIPAVAGTAPLVVRATDVTGASVTGGVSLSIAPPQLSIVNPSPLASGVVGVEYPAAHFSAAGGTGPYKFTVSSGSLPSGLSLSQDGLLTGIPRNVGFTVFTVTVTDSTGATASAGPGITIRPYSTDLVLSAGSLAFRYLAGSPVLPSAQTVGVQSTNVAIPLRYAASVTTSANWLTVGSGGTTPGTLSVSLNDNARSLPGGNTPYQATVTVNCVAPSPCAGTSQSFLVALDARIAPAALEVSTDLLSLTSTSSSGSVVLQNTGGGSVGIASVSCAAAWCRVSGTPPFIDAGGSATLSISGSGLSSGFYRTTLNIRASTGDYSVPVTYFSAGVSSMVLNPSGVQYLSAVGGIPVGGPNSFYVNTSGAGPVNWTAAVVPGTSWLTVNTPSGTSTTSNPSSVTFSINPAVASGLAVGAYYGRIRVTASGVTNSPLDFEVVLNVAPADSPLKPNPSPAGLLFITSATSPAPPQAVQIATGSTSPVPYQAAAYTNSGANWLAVGSTTGTANPGAPGQSQVSVAPAGLAPGVYYGGVNYAYGTAGVRTVNVTMIVTPAASSSGTAGRLTTLADTPGCSPKGLVAAQVGLVNNFSAPAAWPTPLSVRLMTDCAIPITNGQVVATFSNGDAPIALTLADPQAGTYSGTWTPRKTGAQVAISARASAPGFTAVTAILNGAVTPNAAPVLTPHSTLHVFDPQVGAGLGPGTIIQMYGQFLAPDTTLAPSIPLSTKLSGTSVLIGGIEAPLFFVSPGQINAQIPFELQPNQQYQVIVSANGALTTPDTLQLTPVSPGMAALPTGTVIAQHSDGSLVSSAAPAKPGEFLVMYVAGLGATDNPVTTGAASPSNPLARPQTAPALTIGSDSARILFAGLTPGLVGLYQVNFEVPPSAPNGDLELVLKQDNLPGNTTILPVHN